MIISLSGKPNGFDFVKHVDPGDTPKERKQSQVKRWPRAAFEKKGYNDTRHAIECTSSSAMEQPVLRRCYVLV